MEADMKRASVISTLILTAIVYLTINGKSVVLAQTSPAIDIDVQVLDRYTRNELDSVRVALYFDGVLLDSTVTSADGRALFRISVTSLEQPAELPAELSLSPNYPNPFNSDTRVDLGVPEAQSVRIEIFNVIGQRVAIQSMNLDAGRYALNLSMGHLPVGVYFLRISGRESRVEKMAKLGKGFISQGAMFRMEPAGGYNQSRPVVEQKSGVGYLANTGENNDTGYSLRAERNRYRDFETNPEIQGNTELLVEMQRQNVVSITTVNLDGEPVNRTVRIQGDNFDITTQTPDTLLLDSGIYTVASADEPAPESPADFVINDVIEVISTDSSYTIVPFIPLDVQVSGKVISERETFVSGARVNVYLNGALYTSATSDNDGGYSLELNADGSLYSLVVYPELLPSGPFVPEEAYSFTSNAQVLRPKPGVEYERDFILYSETPLVIPGGSGTLPVGNYTLSNDDGTVSIANIPPSLGIAGGSARAFSPTVTPDAFPGEFATRQPGLESDLFSGGFASVNLLRNDGSGGVEPVSELRDSTGNPVIVELRFIMDPNDYDVLRDPATLSNLPGYVNRPDTIDVPLYYYDEQAGDWLLTSEFGWLENEKGAIPFTELQNILDGLFEDPVYVVGLVDHFSWYNLDFPAPQACMRGRLVDQNSRPVKNGKVSARSMPRTSQFASYKGVTTGTTDKDGYFRIVTVRSERNSGDDWNNNKRTDTYRVQGSYNDKAACSLVEFDNNGRGYVTPTQSIDDGCGNFGTIRVSVRKAEKLTFKIQFTDIPRNGQPGRPLFVDPPSIDGLNYAYASLVDLKVPLLGELWNCACDNGTSFPDCNRLSIIDGDGVAEFRIPVIKRDSNNPIESEEKLAGQFSYRKMTPDRGFGAYEVAQCAYLTSTKPPSGSDPIVVECEVEIRGVPTIEIVRVEGDSAGIRDFLYDEVVTLEATGRTENGDNFDFTDNFYWTNALETFFIASRRVVNRPANELFGTGSALSIRAHGVDFYGFKGDTLASGISVAEVSIEASASRTIMAPGDTAFGRAIINGAKNTSARWQSMTPSIASATPDSLIIGLQPGTAIIRAQSLADMSKTATTEIEIINLFAEFSVSPAAGDSLTEFFFDASESVGEITQYAWNFGDGNTATGQTVSHIYGTGGVFTVRLTVTGPMGFIVSKTRTVSTTGQSLAVIAADPVFGAAPLKVFFDGRGSLSSSGNITVYSWNFGDGGIAVGDTISYEYASPGTFTASLTVTDAGNSTSADSVIITVVAPPVASFTIDPESGLPPLEITVDASESGYEGGTITAYTWDFGDGTVINQGQVVETHTYVDTGIYDIRLTVETNDGLTGSVINTINVGCETFTGNLTVNTEEQLNNLRTLCRIEGNVSISSFSSLEILTGFDNLTEITGFFSIGNNPSLTQIAGFNRLKRVGGNLFIQSNNALTQMIGFDGLKEMQNLTIESNPALAVIPGFTSLEKINSLSVVVTAIQSISGFGNLVDAPAGISVINNPDLTNIAGFENLERYINLLHVNSNPGLEQIDAFHNLTGLGDLRVEGNTSLQEISGFNKVRRIPANLRIINSPQLSAVDAFGILDEVRGQFIFNNTGYSACNILDIYFRIIDNNGFGTFQVSITGNPNTSGAVTIQTQDQLDSLSGVCLINGGLTFSTQLSEISGLEQLRRVNGSVSINFNPNITNLEFLPNLRQSDGINIRGNASLQSIAGLDSMKRLVNISIWDQPLITDMEPLSGLMQITGGINLRETGIVTLPDFNFTHLSSSPPSISIQDNPALVDFDGLKVFKTAGMIRIQNNPSLVSVQGLSGLTSTGAGTSINILNNPQLTSLEGLHNLETMFQSSVLELNNNGIEDLNGLRNLKAAGVIRIENSPVIRDVDELANVTSLSRLILINTGISNLDGLSNSSGELLSIFLENNGQLTSISGLSGTDQVRFLVTISGNPLLASLDGLQNIARIGLTSTNGVLHILNNAALQDVNGLAGLTAVDEIRITGNPLLTNLDGLQNLGGTVVTLHIDNNASLEQIDGLQGVSAVTSWMRVFGNDSLTNLDGFSGISGNVNLIEISQNPEMTSIAGLSGITSSNELSVGNTGITTLDGLENLKNTLTLGIGNNPNLQNLDALSGLERVTRMFVRFNPSLVSVSGMTALARVVNDFNVSLNPALPSCDVDKLIAQIQAAQGIGGTISTSGNDPDGVCEPI